MLLIKDLLIFYSLVILPALLDSLEHLGRVKIFQNSDDGWVAHASRNESVKRYERIILTFYLEFG